MIGYLIYRQGGRTLVPRLDQAVPEIGKEINVKDQEAPDEEVREFRVEEDNWNKWNAAKLEKQERVFQLGPLVKLSISIYFKINSKMSKKTVKDLD
jgi:hypothetical protein